MAIDERDAYTHARVSRHKDSVRTRIITRCVWGGPRFATTTNAIVSQVTIFSHSFWLKKRVRPRSSYLYRLYCPWNEAPPRHPKTSRLFVIWSSSFRFGRVACIYKIPLMSAAFLFARGHVTYKRKGIIIVCWIRRRFNFDTDILIFQYNDYLGSELSEKVIITTIFLLYNV